MAFPLFIGPLSQRRPVINNVLFDRPLVLKHTWNLYIAKIHHKPHTLSLTFNFQPKYLNTRAIDWFISIDLFLSVYSYEAALLASRIG